MSIDSSAACAQRLWHIIMSGFHPPCTAVWRKVTYPKQRKAKLRPFWRNWSRSSLLIPEPTNIHRRPRRNAQIVVALSMTTARPCVVRSVELFGSTLVVWAYALVHYDDLISDAGKELHWFCEPCYATVINPVNDDLVTQLFQRFSQQLAQIEEKLDATVDSTKTY